MKGLSYPKQRLWFALRSLIENLHLGSFERALSALFANMKNRWKQIEKGFMIKCLYNESIRVWVGKIVAAIVFGVKLKAKMNYSLKVFFLFGVLF